VTGLAFPGVWKRQGRSERKEGEQPGSIELHNVIQKKGDRLNRSVKISRRNTQWAVAPHGEVSGMVRGLSAGEEGVTNKKMIGGVGNRPTEGT